jgi:hypothetical protein
MIRRSVAYFTGFSVAFYFDLRRRFEGGDPEAEGRAALAGRARCRSLSRDRDRPVGLAHGTCPSGHVPLFACASTHAPGHAPPRARGVRVRARGAAGFPGLGSRPGFA